MNSESRDAGLKNYAEIEIKYLYSKFIHPTDIKGVPRGYTVSALYVLILEFNGSDS